MRLVEGSNVATATIHLVPDPRQTYSMADRRAQHALSEKLYADLNTMTALVERIVAVRGALDARAAAVPAGDPLAAQLRAASAAVDSMRMKIVATKEGGMITGEERLRENLTGLYGSVSNYDGKPSQMQTERASAIEREMGDVAKAFDAWLAGQLPAINKALEAKGAKAIVMPKG